MRTSLLLLAAAIAVSPVAALAQESPTSTWGSSVTWRNAFDRSVDISRAEAQKRARDGGYGPGQVVTTYNGDVQSTTTQTFEGSVSNNSSTNAVNLNSFSSNVKNENGSVGVTFETGSSSYHASQTAAAQTATSQNGPASTTALSTTGNGSR